MSVQRGGGRQVILVVDSDAAGLRLMSSVLGRQAEVLAAATTDQAFDELRRRRVDALVTVLDLAGTDGVTFLRQAGAIRSGVGRVLVGPRRQAAAVLSAVEERAATAFVLAPFMPEELAVAVHRALRTQPPRVLLVTQDNEFQRRLFTFLTGAGIDCAEADDSAEVLHRLEGVAWDAAVVDLDLGAESGLDLLAELRVRSPEVRALLCGEHALPQLASDLRRMGAYDYFAKTSPDDQILLRILCAYEDRTWAVETARAATTDEAAPSIVGSSRDMEAVRTLAKTVGQTTAPVLIRGETGTGKELVARQIHTSSPRHKGPFFAVNCAALTEALFESEMFGHERGAFTGAVLAKPGMCELANEGTLFLDEIGELAPTAQAKLLRYLQSGEFIRVGGRHVLHSDARVIAATNRPLEKMIDDGTFRADLFHRLNILEIRIPALRAHPEDIPELVSQLLVRLGKKHNRGNTRLSPRAFEKLLAHSWPGNVRELEGVLERAVLIAPGAVVQDVQIAAPRTSGGSATGIAVNIDLPLRDTMDAATKQVEREYLVRLLTSCGGNVINAAKRADIDRRNFYRKLEDHGLDPEAFRRRTKTVPIEPTG